MAIDEPPMRRAPERGVCACPAHVDDELLATPVPYARGFADHAGTGNDAQVTVGDLIEMGALTVRALDPDDEADEPDLEDGFQHEAWVGDEAVAHYDDEDTELDLDESLAQRTGVEEVSWEDRELLLVNAPTLCTDGVLTALAHALLDPRVRQVSESGDD